MSCFLIAHVDGQPLIHHGREYRVMTNDPPYGQQLALLKKMDFSHPSSAKSLPGNVKPSDRFQRASYFLPMLPQPKSEREAVAGMFSIVRNVSVPFRAPYKGFGSHNTEYRPVMDLTGKLYFFELTTGASVMWPDLTKFHLAPGDAVMILNPDKVQLSGDVSGKFSREDKSPF